ncbi:MAG: hypothetical protein ACRDKZ_01330 [Actinomycetota bacterium]
MPGDFEARQRAFAERVGAQGHDALASGTIVVIPSISFPSAELRKITGIQHYEERLLFLLLWLKNPALRIVYVTSHRIDPVIVDYYLRWLDDPRAARSRLDFVSLDDHEPRGLSAKLVERPDVLDQLRELLSDRDEAVLLPFNVTTWERTLSDILDVPLYGPAPSSATSGRSLDRGGSRARRACPCSRAPRTSTRSTRCRRRSTC